MAEQVLLWHPYATKRNQDGSTERLWTVDGCPDKEKALDAIRKWADDYGYHLISAEIKVSNLKRPDMYEWIRVF